jgi:hypothetical protein
VDISLIHGIIYGKFVGLCSPQEDKATPLSLLCKSLNRAGLQEEARSEIIKEIRSQGLLT